ncbi:protein phosphatase 2C domain-containing protein [Streptomyces bobili]|uniref:protein phosphatase 2C domain-containing protein n=1 Tax=Streptomyces bobili TaxID=67280 RepID=UPI00365B6CF5
MSQQGGRPTGHEDDWWGQLYDDTTEDTGPTAAADSLDDRFASAAGTVRSGAPAEADPAGPAVGPVPGEASGAAPASVPRPRREPTERADWWAGTGEPTGQQESAPQPKPRPKPQPPSVEAADDSPPHSPPDRLSGPTGVPRGPLPPGFDEQEPQGSAPPGRTSPQAAPTSPAPTSPAPESQPPAGTAPTAPHPAQPGTPLHDLDDPRSPKPPHPPNRPRDPSDWITAAPTTPPQPPERLQPTQPPEPHRPPQPHGLPPAKPYLGSGPPTYDADPTALPAADPDGLDDLVPDTVLDGARYGACTLRAASVRGDSARYRGEPRRDALLTARFGTGEQALILVAMATGTRATPGAHRAAAEVCHWIGRAVGRSQVRLAQDMRAARRGDLKSGLHRLTDRSLGRLRASAAEQGLDPEEYAAGLRCLLLPADPACRVRVFFGVGPGGLFRLRDGEWRDIEPPVGEVAGEPVVGFGALPAETPEGDRLTMDFGIPTPPSPYEPAPGPPREPFRFRASVARPGDTLLMCTEGLAEPLRGEPELPAHLVRRWSAPTPPGLAAFLADTQIRVKGYADDRTAAAVWEA